MFGGSHSGNKPRVLMIWPGGEASVGGNFGVPQFVGMASFLEAKTGVRADIRDLEAERAFGPVSLPKLVRGEDDTGYDVIAFGCYSSFDYLKCLTMAELAREHCPHAVILAGGYHVSARPDDIVFDGSPFDVAVVGEGEHAMVEIVESVAGGSPIRHKILYPEPIQNLDDLPVTDWTLLARYQSIARSIASQAQLYLSRGCPFDCAFCMERAKREVSWRGYSVERAIEELRGLHRFLDLTSWTVYIADALFGMKPSWRRAFLEAMARENIPAEKFWLLIRVDLIQDEDLPLFNAANCSLGFGLESGDPGLLSIIRKAGRLDDYLDRMLEVSRKAREIDLPWGANVICGHPGETEQSMRVSADYMKKLFLHPGGVTGFLSVDPFRLYPGSPIDAEKHEWQAKHGTKFYRPNWWHDGDQEFLAEWVDPSSQLTYRRREELQHQLLSPVLHQLRDNFRYQGKAVDYFYRAIDEQIELTKDRTRWHYGERYYAWNRYLGKTSAARRELASDLSFQQVAQRKREPELRLAKARCEELFGPGSVSERLLEIMRGTPREIFCPLDELDDSLVDAPVVLTPAGLSTVSAMHAYLLSFSLLSLQPGDWVLDLGAGTGYGAMMLTRLVGESGYVAAIEVDPKLAAIGAELLAKRSNCQFLAGNALDCNAWPKLGRRWTKINVGFAMPEIPNHWLPYLDNGTVLVAPVVFGAEQWLTRAVVKNGTWEYQKITRVIYVPARERAEPADTVEKSRVLQAVDEGKIRLPVMR